MSHVIGLHTSYPAVQALVGPWLDDSRLTTDRPLTLEVEVATVPPADPENPIVFRQGAVAIRRGPSDGESILHWDVDLGRAVIARQATSAIVIVSQAGLQRPNELLRSFLLTVCVLLLRRAGLHHAHSASLRDPRGRGWLIAGASGSGKSTTSAILARQGWSIGTDDIAFLTEGASPGTTEVVAWRERLALHGDAVAATGHAGGAPLEARGKTGWYAEELGAEWVQRVTPAFLAFPTVRAFSPTVVTPLRPRDALSRLLPSSPWVALEADYADENLALMTQLVTQAPAFEISLGRDLFDRPELLLELVAA